MPYLLPELVYLKSAVRSRSLENVRNKNGCVVLLERSIYHLVLLVLFNHCHTNKFFE